MISDVMTTGVGTESIPPVNPKGQLGKEEFLQMLVAQLKNQDPMNPMKGDDMAAQLAQFSSLEQLTNISKQLEAQATGQDGLIGSINDTTAMNVLGKTVLAVGDHVEVPGDGSGSVHLGVGGDGGLATLTIMDETGREVGSRPLGFVGAGRHDVELGSAAEDLPAGSYSYAIDVVDAAGKPVPTQPFVTARIDGVEYGEHGPVLTSGGLLIPFGTILQIRTE
ncbi:MAG: flagellar hook capping FlgD N-terminal domain-containing protein [Gemmatimonadota bacterium]